MKLTGLSCVMAALLLAGCQKRVAESNEENDVAPSAIAVTQPATPQYAPPGVFYLLAPIRKETRDGIVRLLPGTEVKLLHNGKYQTPEGEMVLDPRTLTNDRTAASTAQNVDSRRQAAARPKTLPVAAAATVTPTSAPSRSWLAALRPTATPAAAISTDEKVRAMKFRLAVLKDEETRLQANVTYLWEKALHVPNSKKSQGAPQGLSGSTSLGDWDYLNAKLAAVQGEIQELETKLQGAAN